MKEEQERKRQQRLMEDLQDGEDFAAYQQRNNNIED
jgi:hypothetical protein